MKLRAVHSAQARVRDQALPLATYMILQFKSPVTWTLHRSCAPTLPPPPTFPSSSSWNDSFEAWDWLCHVLNNFSVVSYYCLIGKAPYAEQGPPPPLLSPSCTVLPWPLYLPFFSIFLRCCMCCFSTWTWPSLLCSPGHLLLIILVLNRGSLNFLD